MIIIIGATGQVGSHLLDMFYKNSNEIIFPLSSSHIDLTKTLILGDFFSELTRNAKLVINCSAYNDVDGMELDTQKRSDGYAINSNMISALVSNCNAPIIHISTDYVFDKGDNIDADTPKPMSHYGLSKMLGECEALEHGHSYVFRTSCVYSNKDNNFVAKIIKRAMEANNSDFKKTVLLPRLYSTPNSAKFVANGIFKAAQAILENRMPSKRIYHLTTIGSESRADFANFICKTLSITGTVFVSQEDHPSLQYRPARSNLIFSEELESIGIQRLHWIDDFCDYFMNDLYKMKRQQ